MILKLTTHVTRAVLFSKENSEEKYFDTNIEYIKLITAKDLPFSCNQYNFHIAAIYNLGPVRRQARSVMMSVQKKGIYYRH